MTTHIPPLCRICLRPATAPPHPGCVARLDEALAELPGLYRALASVLLPGTVPAGARVSGSRTPPLPVALGPLSLRARGGIVGVLADWEDAVRSALEWPERPLRGSIEHTVDGTVAFLRAQLLWICDAFEPAAEFAHEIRHLVAQCRCCLGERSDARVIGYCPAVLDDGTECGRPLRASPESEVIRCTCGASWLRAQWMTLGAVLREQEAAA